MVDRMRRRVIELARARSCATSARRLQTPRAARPSSARSGAGGSSEARLLPARGAARAAPQRGARPSPRWPPCW
jgi:hypothetical protein